MEANNPLMQFAGNSGEQNQTGSPSGSTPNPLMQFVGNDEPATKTQPAPHPVEQQAPRREVIGNDAADLEKYAEMPWSDVASSAAQHLIPSAETALSGVGHAIVHPVETMGAIGQLGQGAYSQMKGALGFQQDPQEKARQESLLNSLEEHYAQTYGSWGGFKKALATDPFSVGMDISVPLTLGESAIPESAGMAGRVASLAGKVGTLMDPVQTSLAVAKGLGKGAGTVMRAAQGLSTGVSPSLLKIAGDAGSTSDPALRQAFVTHLSGQGDATDIATKAAQALAEIKAQKSAEYMNTKSGLISNSTPIDFSKVDKAINDARAKTQFSGISGTFKPANSALNEAENIVNSFRNGPPAAQTLEGFDNMKQAIWDLKNQYGNPAAQSALMGVYHGIRDSLFDHDPEYAKLMETYTEGLNNTNDITKTLGLSSKTAASSALARMLKATKTSNGQSLLDQISNTTAGRSVPYMLAGQALNAWAPGGARNLLEALLMYGAVAIHPGMAAGIVAQSPRVMGGINYGLGAAQRYGSPLLSKPVTYGAEQIGETTGGTQPPDQVSKILNTIKTQESAGSANPYTARNQISSASGAYQFTDGTWSELTNKYGIGREYLHASDAPPAIQDAVASRRVEEILQANGGDVSKVPLMWYTGNAEGHISPSALALNGGLTPAEYQRHWMHRFQTAAATGGRIERASGGRTGLDHKAEAERLINAVDRVRKAQSGHTKAFLDLPDEVVTKALAAANEAI